MGQGWRELTSVLLLHWLYLSHMTTPNHKHAGKRSLARRFQRNGFGGHCVCQGWCLGVNDCVFKTQSLQSMRVQTLEKIEKGKEMSGSIRKENRQGSAKVGNIQEQIFLIKTPFPK